MDTEIEKIISALEQELIARIRRKREYIESIEFHNYRMATPEQNQEIEYRKETLETMNHVITVILQCLTLPRPYLLQQSEVIEGGVVINTDDYNLLLYIK
jgi:hypothetical protein